MRPYRPDRNQARIIQTLRQAGASVFDLAPVGCGVPDLLVGFAGHNYLIEIKNMTGRGMRFTEPERRFMDTWRGTVRVVTDELQAIDVLTGDDV